MSELKRTVLYDRHVNAGAQMVPFGGWDMPVMYGGGILAEHLATRKGAGMFDVSHMGRFVFRGPGALDFLQYALTNNAEALDTPDNGAQYTLIPTEAGTAVDDAYLYRFVADEYLLVVNAGNRDKDWQHFQAMLGKFDDVELIDRSDDLAMVSVQGPASRSIVSGIIEAGRLPEPARNALGRVTIAGATVLMARTGYTGEPLGFELFIPAGTAATIWDLLVEKGVTPVGLGARDTLRLEAALPLYGHELGMDPDGGEIPIFACPLAKFGVSFSPLKGDFVGRRALARQYEAFQKILFRDFSNVADLPRTIRPLALAGRGIARQGARLYRDDRHIGYVTSGTMVPFWEFEGQGVHAGLGDDSRRRSICLAYLDSDILDEEPLSVEIRGKRLPAMAVPYHMRSESPPYTRPILADHGRIRKSVESDATRTDALRLLDMATANHRWRQQACINLIPSEMTSSPLVRMLSITDASFRYAEHRKLKAYYDADVFYYQGCDFIDTVEALLITEMKRYFGCAEVETRTISGTDGQHRRIQRHAGLPQPGRPQTRTATDAQGDEQSHRQGWPPQRPTHGCPQGFRGTRPGNRAAGGGQFPGAAGQSVSHRRAGRPRADRPAPPGTDRFRQEHGDLQGACPTGEGISGCPGHRHGGDVRHGPRAGTGGTPFPRPV